MVGNSRRVLLIEDDGETADSLVEFLGSKGYAVDLARDGDEGLRRGGENAHAVLVIDRMLPGLDGLGIIRALRDRGIDTPALIISALGEVDDRIRGLRAGGDDYLVKPFSLYEMLARVDALARRSSAVLKETMLRVGDLEMDLLTREVRRAGHAIELLPREFKLLEYLVRNAGQTVSRLMLLEHVWDLHFDPSTNIIDVHISNVRRKIDRAGLPPLIHTVRGAGFCIHAR